MIARKYILFRMQILQKCVQTLVHRSVVNIYAEMHSYTLTHNFIIEEMKDEDGNR